MSIFRNVVLNLKTEQECDRAISLYKEQLSSLTGEGIENVYICRLSKDSVLFFVTIDNEDNAKRTTSGPRRISRRENFRIEYSYTAT